MFFPAASLDRGVLLKVGAEGLKLKGLWLRVCDGMQLNGYQQHLPSIGGIAMSRQWNFHNEQDATSGQCEHA